MFITAFVFLIECVIFEKKDYGTCMSLDIGKHFMKYRVVTYDLYFQSEANWSMGGSDKQHISE